MRLFFIPLLLCCLSTVVIAKESAPNKQEQLITKLLNQQIRQNISVQHSVSALLKRYPEKVEAVVKAAIHTYPNKYINKLCSVLLQPNLH